MQLQKRAAGLRAASSRRSTVRVCAQAQVATVTARPAVRSVEHEVPAELDVEAMYKRLEARSKALIQLEERESSTYPKVKFTLKQKVGLGECWKIVASSVCLLGCSVASVSHIALVALCILVDTTGMCPELGRMKPEVAPYMQWTNGDVWTLEAKMRPGTYEFKAVLRKPDGSYLWEDGKDRVLEVPFGASGKNVELTNIKFPGA
ncbi:hypothetical protein CHLRE_03g183300v5 [Chlamydomonas reinhardtii]|uniref:CBM20 domain-containing protein n=1 Tax=Chlamydomonas reinhardtii TaxID=3055 RepID=A0A2K3DXV4_CHLRE|nr:uncharacterized protein CHLRE_03g183300v5 [Chlamydomonas reinhardtii]PNW85372.1 hypothetical protein CHLRE_03g183300v5 [Chlamydomonas reinhardtii]